MIPYELVQAYASLFNDRDHSDVVFVIRPPASRRDPHPKERRLYAIKKILAARSDYFSTMFEGGWSEGQELVASPSSSSLGTDVEVDSTEAEDDDDDDDVFSTFSDEESDPPEESSDTPASGLFAAVPTTEADRSTSPFPSPQPVASTQEEKAGDVSEKEASTRSRTFSATSSTADATASETPFSSPMKRPAKQSSRRKRKDGNGVQKARIVVPDATYKTFKALLYYLYTDAIGVCALNSINESSRVLRSLCASGVIVSRRSRNGSIKISAVPVHDQVSMGEGDQ